ncbi:TIGR02221 family CRISPR-associated protein [Soehngenia longivitae]|uniref:TIGR02221 family CRISPR-associated protein n=1 Tax=Soehngenia longivitae TaxID=2562294 RepID=A0A4Z0D242_9FIRM|nr:TIGR02221 family CRISPR-associated protein [Soehngenia longivitae]TFZ39378.1 TIGR02221 family CRISPR-associated protein [Soehngenia longivitae]
MKKVITFLGTGKYELMTYKLENEQGEKFEFTSKYVQSALAKMLNDVKFYVVLTEEAKKIHWIGSEGNGLKKEFDENCTSYEEVPIMDGKSEIEIWEIFNTVYDLIEEKDEIYVDITHSFRSIPLIIMSVLNYAKYTKNINIKKIYYGAFEAKTVDNHEPIFDLSLFNKLTDWSIAADKFLKTGYSEDLSSLIHQAVSQLASKNKEAQKVDKLQKKLNEFSNSLYTVRGKKISDLGLDIKNMLTDLVTINIDELKPFEKILNKVKDIFEPYSGDIVFDIYYTANLCAKFNLVQQSYTFLRENIINYVASSLHMNLFDRNNRVMIENSLNDKSDRNLNSQIENIVDYDLRVLYKNIGEFRNALAHAGFNDNSPKENKIYDNLKEFIKKFEDQVLTKYLADKGL